MLALAAETVDTRADCDVLVTTEVATAGIDAVDIRACVVDVGAAVREFEDSAASRLTTWSQV